MPPDLTAIVRGGPGSRTYLLPTQFGVRRKIGGLFPSQCRCVPKWVAAYSQLEHIVPTLSEHSSGACEIVTMQTENVKGRAALGRARGGNVMSANQYAVRIKTAEIRKADRTWFP